MAKADHHKRKKNKGLKRPGVERKVKDMKLKRCRLPPSSGLFDEAPGIDVSKGDEEEHVPKDTSNFDNLLTALGSGREKLARLYSRRQRAQEGQSETEDDEDDAKGSNSESSLENFEEEELRESGSADSMEYSEENETGDEDEDSIRDDSDDLEEDDLAVDDADKISSFDLHVGRTISTEEVDNLLKLKWTYKWEIPATGMPSSKWVGTGENPLRGDDSDLDYGLKQKLYKHWQDIYGTSGSSHFHSSKQRLFFSLCNSYRDIMHCNKKPFYLKGLEEDSSIMDAYIMHALNHISKTRDAIIKNDAKLTKHQESNAEEILHGGSFLDHGFTRPKVMFLLPLGSIALRVVKRLIELTPLSNRAKVDHLDRFSKEFGSGDGEDDENEDDNKSKKSAKPADHQVLFGGNNNDHFMIGIKFTKRSIRLYSDFYSSDIIVASPLGLVTKIGEAEAEREKDVDYLSSIELLIIDHADIIAMQNWSHVNTVVNQLNHMPVKQHGTDVMRIRQWCLDGHARLYRQTILLSSFLNPDMNAVFNRLCVNYEGKVKLVSEHKGVLPKVLLQVRQIYERFDAPSIVDVDDARLDYFVNKDYEWFLRGDYSMEEMSQTYQKELTMTRLVLHLCYVFPKLKESIEGGTMLFMSSYFEFVRLRNFLKSQNASFCLLGEYTKPSDISRARVWFFEGKRKIMLYTERAHFYHRYKIRGIQNLIIYSLPERKEFYPEIINMLEGSKSMTCNVLFSRLDNLKLERIVGTSASKRMLSSDKGMFLFC